MADEKTATPKPPPAPPKPQKTVVQRAREDIAQARTGMHPVRPLVYALAFAKGTVNGFFGGLARWGRFGLKWGLIGGALAAVGLPALNLSLGLAGADAIGFAVFGAAATVTSLAPVFMCMLAGFALGAALGATQGLLTGGKREMGREIRRDKYAEDLVQRSKVRKAMPTPQRATYRQMERDRNARDTFMTAYLLDRQNEDRRDNATYWQDSTTSSRGFGGMGR